MKRIICALLACTICASVAIGFSGCGCNNNQGPGYVIEPTEPDISENGFGYFIINSEELMLTEYTGSETDVKIPDTYKEFTITTIGRSVFNGSDITSVEIPDTVTTIQDYAFAFCKSLSSVKLSNNLESLGSNAFYRCTMLKSIEFPSSIKDLGIYTFSASGLQSVTIPESENLTEIRDYVFYQCQYLTDVTLPKTLTSINDNAFEDCPNKITITAPEGSEAEAYAKKNNFEYIKG